MGSGSQQGGGGGYGAPQMGSGYGMPGGGIASMMGGMSPGMGGGMFGQQGGPMGGFMGGQGGQYGQPSAGGSYGAQVNPMRPGMGGGFMGGQGGQYGQPGFGRPGAPPRDPNTGYPVGAQVSKPIDQYGFTPRMGTQGPGDGGAPSGPFGYGGNRPGGQGNFMQGIAQLFNPNGGGATQQGQSQMITGGQYPGMQGQPGGPPMNTLPYFPGTPPMHGQPGGPPMRRTQGSMMGQFGAL